MINMTGTEIERRLSCTASRPERPSARLISATTSSGLCACTIATASSWVRATPIILCPSCLNSSATSDAISGSSSIMNAVVAVSSAIWWDASSSKCVRRVLLTLSTFAASSLENPSTAVRRNASLAMGVMACRRRSEAATAELSLGREGWRFTSTEFQNSLWCKNVISVHAPVCFALQMWAVQLSSAWGLAVSEELAYLNIAASCGALVPLSKRAGACLHPS